MRGDSCPVGRVFETHTRALDAIVSLSAVRRVNCFCTLIVDVSHMIFALLGLWWLSLTPVTSSSRLLKWCRLQFLLECLSRSLKSVWGKEPLLSSPVLLKRYTSLLGTWGLLLAERGVQFIPPHVSWTLSLDPVEADDGDKEDLAVVNGMARPRCAGVSEVMLRCLVSVLERLVRLLRRGTPEALSDIDFMLDIMVEDGHKTQIWEEITNQNLD